MLEDENRNLLAGVSAGQKTRKEAARQRKAEHPVKPAVSETRTPLKGRGGPGRGQGRKPLAGEPMKIRGVKMTDAQWVDFKFVTAQRVREWVAKEAARLRAAAACPDDAA